MFSCINIQTLNCMEFCNASKPLLVIFGRFFSYILRCYVTNCRRSLSERGNFLRNNIQSCPRDWHIRATIVQTHLMKSLYHLLAQYSSLNYRCKFTHTILSKVSEYQTHVTQQIPCCLYVIRNWAMTFTAHIQKLQKQKIKKETPFFPCKWEDLIIAKWNFAENPFS